MKIIAITQNIFQDNKTSEIKESLDTRWYSLSKRLNYILLPISSCSDLNNYFKGINIDGIILSGGNDLHCISNNSLSLKRDKFEKKIISYCIRNKLPLLGVCRGMQIVGKFFCSNIKKVKNHTAVNHSIKINNNSHYYEMLKNIHSVNSYHNFALDDIDKNFIISAKSHDGIIEAVEHKNLKIWCQMWHPEREKKFNKFQIKIIENLFI